MGWSMETSIRVMPWFLVILGEHTACRHLVLTHDMTISIKPTPYESCFMKITREDTSSVSKAPRNNKLEGGVVRRSNQLEKLP